MVAKSASQSNGNYSSGRDIANLSVVPLDADGSFCVFVETPVHFIVDVQGGFRSGGQLGLMGGLFAGRLGGTGAHHRAGDTHAQHAQGRGGDGQFGGQAQGAKHRGHGDAWMSEGFH